MWVAESRLVAEIVSYVWGCIRNGADVSLVQDTFITELYSETRDSVALEFIRFIQKEHDDTGNTRDKGTSIVMIIEASYMIRPMGCRSHEDELSAPRSCVASLRKRWQYRLYMMSLVFPDADILSNLSCPLSTSWTTSARR